MWVTKWLRVTEAKCPTATKIWDSQLITEGHANLLKTDHFGSNFFFGGRAPKAAYPTRASCVMRRAPIFSEQAVFGGFVPIIVLVVKVDFFWGVSLKTVFFLQKFQLFKFEYFHQKVFKGLNFFFFLERDFV